MSDAISQYVFKVFGLTGAITLAAINHTAFAVPPLA